MDLAALLLQSFLAGYLYANFLALSKYHAVRESDQRVVFRAGFYGFVLFFAALLLRFISLQLFEPYAEFDRVLVDWALPLLKDVNEIFAKERAVRRAELVVISFLSIPMGVLLPVIINPFIKKFLPAALERVIQKIDELEGFLNRVGFGAMPVMLSLSNGQVYVGFILKTPDPEAGEKVVSIMPLLSGVRRENGSVEFSTNYSSIYEHLDDSNKRRVDGVELDPEDFEVVIRMSLLISARLFDLRTYELIRKNELRLDQPAAPDTSDVDLENEVSANQRRYRPLRPSLKSQVAIRRREGKGFAVNRREP